MPGKSLPLLTYISSTHPSTAYTILSVPATAPFPQIRARYHHLSLQHHPDKSPSSSDLWSKYRDAYDVLKGDRDSYDEALADYNRRVAGDDEEEEEGYRDEVVLNDESERDEGGGFFFECERCGGTETIQVEKGGKAKFDCEGCGNKYVAVYR